MATEERAAGTAPSDLGLLIKRLRSERNWTVRQLASRADVDPSFITRLEGGSRQTMTRQRMVQFAAAFGVPARVLFEAAGLDAAGEDVADGPQWHQDIMSWDVPDSVKDAMTEMMMRVTGEVPPGH